MRLNRLTSSENSVFRQINCSGFLDAANRTTVNISSPGQSGTATLTFTAQNGFSSNEPVTITPVCLGLPSGASCSSGATVIFATNGTATATVTFKTTAPSWVVPDWRSRPDTFGKWTPLEVATLASLCWLWKPFVALQGPQIFTPKRNGFVNYKRRIDRSRNITGCAYW